MSDDVIAVGIYEPGPPGPAGAGAFETVPTGTMLPPAVDAVGAARYIVDTATVVVSDGTTWRALAWSP